MGKTKIGRPRSEKAQEAILDAVDALLAENEGVGLTIEAIAKRAKVGKPTIYRWWPSLADIVLEAGLRGADANIQVRFQESLRETLRSFLRQSMTAIAEGGGVYLRYLMAHAQQDEGFRERFRENFVAKRRGVLCSVLEKSMEQERIEFKQDLGVLVDMVLGAMWYRLLVGHAPMDQGLADELTEIVMSVVCPKST